MKYLLDLDLLDAASLVALALFLSCVAVFASLFAGA